LQDKNIELLTFPCIVKPSGSAGQRGLRKIFNKKELEDFFNNPLIEEEYPAERIGDVYVAEEYVK
jgi:biotin carboxylase